MRPIEVEGLRRCFGDTVAVADIDLEVNEGEIFGFLGPNGAGKSTTVRMLTTLLRPTDGIARVAGFDVVEDAQRVRRAIGVTLQNTALDPLMTGNELLRLQAALHDIPRRVAQTRGAALFDRLGLSDVAAKRVDTYSGGTRRRLDLALSLLHEPTVLFLDEPTTGVDPTSRTALWDEVRALSREHGTTVFLTTQYLEEADRLCGRVAIIDKGCIVRSGTTAALKDEVGGHTLRVEVGPGQIAVARATLTRFGPPRPAPRDALAVGLAGGAGILSDVVRALDAAGVAVVHMQLDAPNLDDVFAAATGNGLSSATELASIDERVPA